MGCGILPISDFRTLAMTFHPLMTLPTDVRSARFFGVCFSALFKDGLEFVDVGSGVCVALVLNIECFASLVRLLVFGFRFTFTVGGMNQISEFHK